jgi:hypothetical protein
MTEVKFVSRRSLWYKGGRPQPFLETPLPNKPSNALRLAMQLQTKCS